MTSPGASPRTTGTPVLMDFIRERVVIDKIGSKFRFLKRFETKMTHFVFFIVFFTVSFPLETGGAGNGKFL